MAIAILTVPASGVGPSSDVSAFALLRTFVVNGTIGPTETIIVEGSGDPVGTPDANRTWAGVLSFNSATPGNVVVQNIASAYRVRRTFGAGVPTVTSPTVVVDALAAPFTSFSTLNVPLGTGLGTVLDLSAIAFDVSNVYVDGPFDIANGETIVIEGSLDNSSYDRIESFNAPKDFGDIAGNYNFLRVRRINGTQQVITAAIGTTASGGLSGSGLDMRALVSRTASAFLPPGYSLELDDLGLLGQTYTCNSDTNPNTQCIVQVNDASSRVQISTLGAIAGYAGLLPLKNAFFATVSSGVTTVAVAEVGNPIAEPWYVEARIRMDDRPTSGISCVSLMGPGGAGGGGMQANFSQCKFVAIGLVGAGVVGIGTGVGSDVFVSFFTWDNAVLRVQTTTITLAQFAAAHSLGMGTKGDGTIRATLDGADTGWSTTNLTGVPNVGCWRFPFVRAQAAVNLRQTVDYMAVAGARL